MNGPATFVDGHLHFWDPDRFHYRWLRGDRHLDRAFLPEHLDAEPAGIVVVQADCLPAESAREAAWIQDLAARGTPVAAIVAHVALEDPAAAAAGLADLAHVPLVTGVRRLLQDEPAGFARRPEFVAGVRLLARHGMTMDLCLRRHQIAEVTALVQDVPEVTFVLDHLGKPRVAATLDAAWARDIRDLAALPNIYCKLSGLATEAVDPCDRHPRGVPAVRPRDLRPLPVLVRQRLAGPDVGHGVRALACGGSRGDRRPDRRRAASGDGGDGDHGLPDRSASSSPARGRRRRPRGVVGWKHCRPLARTLTAQRMFDWLDDQIGSSTGQG